MVMEDREMFIPSAKGRITGRKLIGCCRDCKYRDDKNRCFNEHFQQGNEYQWDINTFAKAALIFEYDESGHFYVGDEFGCIHWEAKE
jgi:hypothetical protein